MANWIYPAPSPTWRRPLSCERVRVNWEHPINRGLVGWWLFNEGTGNIVRDVCNRRHLQGIANFTWGGCPYGTNVDVGNTANLYVAPSFTPGIDDMTGPGTAIVVMKPFGDTQLDGLIGSSANRITDYSGWVFQTDMNTSAYPNSLTATISDDGSNHYYYAGSNFLGTSAWTRWHVVGLKWDGATLTFMGNGNLTSQACTRLPRAHTSRRLLFGVNGAGSDHGGNWSYAALWNRALSDQEMIEAGRYLYGTPSNPRLFIEPRRVYFTKQVDVQGTYHRYPTLSY